MELNLDDSNNIDSNEFSCCESSQQEHSLCIFDIILQDLMFGYGDIYKREDYTILLSKIKEIVTNRELIRFFLPGFPAKSSNKRDKVLGVNADFGEFLALRHLLKTMRKIEAIYEHGVLITILSDFHTFDKLVFVSDAEYYSYQKTLITIIHNIGADDVIEVISLADFQEFKDVAEEERSKKLLSDFGDSDFLAHFDMLVQRDANLREKYLGLKKFMLTDLAQFLPGSPNSKATKTFIKNIARGMMSQGKALDKFLDSQKLITNFIRLSIHNHHPMSGKNAIDLFKNEVDTKSILRTPWHHVVAFDTKNGKFIIDHKRNILNSKENNMILLTVEMDGYGWFYLMLYLSDTYDKIKEINFKAVMIKCGCGLVLKNENENSTLRSDCIHANSLTNMVRQFGVVVLRGFCHFEDEHDFIEFYTERTRHGLIRWNFGTLKKVRADHDIPGFVNSNESLPIHFDFSNPPAYMAISQTDYQYEDYVCPEFVLYCRENSGNACEGMTTFSDANAVVNAIHGRLQCEWRNTTLSYETMLAEPGKGHVYFGGQGNIYNYPLLHRCPSTGRDVLRWGQSWTKSKHPLASQFVFVKVTSSPNNPAPIIDELEQKIESLVFDERFYFAHAYKEADQVYVNNYTMLHGREGFSHKRELWRLQALPASDKIPSYLKNGN